MKNIWIINQFSNTPDMPGHTRQYEIASYMVKKGWNVYVFASDFNLTKRKFSKLKNFEFKQIEYVNGINWNWLRVSPYKKNNILRYINILSFCAVLSFEFLSYFFRIKDKSFRPDIILASSPQLPSTFISLLFAKLIKKPFIAEIRDLWPQVLVDLGGVNKKNFLIRILSFIEKEIYKHSNYVVVLAKGAEKYVRNKGASNVLWLPNGPDLENFNFIKIEKNHTEFGLNRPFKIFYTGAHGDANGLENVIEAAKLIDQKPIKFIFIGDGPKKIELIRSSKNMHNIEFRDAVPKKDIPYILASADAILLSLKNVPLFSYGISPNKLYDAYAIGRPVITTVEGQINEEVRKNKLGCTSPPENPKKLALAVIKLFNTSLDDRIKMGERARNIAEKIYSRQRVNKLYEELFLNLSKGN